MSRRFEVEQAVRVKIYPKVGIFSPSGGGKTYTALRLATGMVEEMERLFGKKYEIWLANNEGSRGKYYANEFNYKIIELDPPHEPEMYYDLIDFAENDENCGILIIDSLSKEWAGEGGCLEIANSIPGTFQNAWKNVSPRHRRVMDKVVDSHLIIIATMRGEDQYVVETDDKGKIKPVKIGVGAKTGKDFEYEFTCTFSLDQKTNYAESFKDNTHLFEKKPAMKLTEQDGINLMQWANESAIEPEKRETKPKETLSESERLEKGLSMIKEIIEEMVAKKITKKVIGDVIKENFELDGKPSNNFNAIKDLSIATKVYNALSELNKKEVK